MLKQLNRNKKKKGFTLIELVIVLAVLAIIALIAIPNFNKVRTDSQKKADDQTCEVIEKVTLMAIADQDMIVATTGGKIRIAAPTSGSGSARIGTIDSITWKPGTTAGTTVGNTNFAAALKEVSNPQQKTMKSYLITINEHEDVTVEAVAAEHSDALS